MNVRPVFRWLVARRVGEGVREGRRWPPCKPVSQRFMLVPHPPGVKPPLSPLKLCALPPSPLRVGWRLPALAATADGRMRALALGSQG